MYKPCQISSIQTDIIVPKLCNTETAHHQLSLSFEMPPGVLPMPSWCHLLLLAPQVPQGWSPLLDASLSSPWRFRREGWLAWSLGQATLPLSCHTSAVWQSSHSQSSLGVPEHAVTFARRLPPHCTMAVLHPRLPQLLFTLQRPSRSWGRARLCRAHLPAGRSRPSTPSENKSVRKSPHSQKKRASLPHPVAGRRLGGDSSASPRGSARVGKPPPLPTVDPGRRGRREFIELGGCYLLK